MSNLEKIIKVMSTLEGKKQKLIIEFKSFSLANPRSAKEKAEQTFKGLSYIEQMRIWYAVGEEEVSFKSIHMLNTEARMSLIQKLIVEDIPETYNEIEERFCTKYMVDSDQEEKLKEEEAEEYSDDDQSIVDAIKESYGEDEE